MKTANQKYVTCEGFFILNSCKLHNFLNMLHSDGMFLGVGVGYPHDPWVVS